MGGLALLVFFWGIAVFIFRGDSEGNKERGRNIMIWGVIALFVMISVWGIIDLVQRDLGIDEVSSNQVDPLPNRPETTA